MIRERIMPCLLIEDGGLVKTIKFSNPRYIGDPINAIHIFNEKDVDEMIRQIGRTLAEALNMVFAGVA